VQMRAPGPENIRVPSARRFPKKLHVALSSSSATDIDLPDEPDAA